MSQGTWLEGEPPHRHKGLDALWAAVELERPDNPRPDAPPSWAFRSLLKYRCRVEDLLQHNSGWLETGNGSIRAMIALTEATSGELKKATKSIDDVLCAFLDPEERSFSLKTLIDAGYPDVDLKQIEMDEY